MQLKNFCLLVQIKVSVMRDGIAIEVFPSNKLYREILSYLMPDHLYPAMVWCQESKPFLWMKHMFVRRDFPGRKNGGIAPGQETLLDQRT